MPHRGNLVMKIAFLGIGAMGAPIAGHLLKAGYSLTVWNRTPGRAEALTKAGAKAAATAQNAVEDADVLITSLFDDAAYEAVLFGPNNALEKLKPGALHISLSTISVALSERLTAEHAQLGHKY